MTTAALLPGRENDAIEAAIQSVPGAPAAGVLRGRTLVLYDGVCGLCNRTVRLLLRHDRDGRLFYAPLESPLGRAVLLAHPELPSDPAAVESVLVLSDMLTGRQRLHVRSDAALTALGALGGPWARIAALGLLVPRRLRDSVYRLVARVRYRLFGKLAFCPLPSPAERSHILG